MNDLVRERFINTTLAQELHKTLAEVAELRDLLKTVSQTQSIERIRELVRTVLEPKNGD